jgi:hypothetical protein
VLHHSMVGASHDRTEFVCCLAPSFYKATNAYTRAPPSEPHLILITSQRPPTVNVINMNLGSEFPTHELWGMHSDPNIQHRQIVGKNPPMEQLHTCSERS